MIFRSSSSICPTVGQTMFPKAVPEGPRRMTDLIDEAETCGLKYSGREGN